MTIEELRANIAVIRNAIPYGRLAWNELDFLITRIENIINQTDPLRLPPTQAEVDNIANLQTPLYLAALTKIEQAGDMLGSDALN